MSPLFVDISFAFYIILHGFRRIIQTGTIILAFDVRISILFILMAEGLGNKSINLLSADAANNELVI